MSFTVTTNPTRTSCLHCGIKKVNWSWVLIVAQLLFCIRQWSLLSSVALQENHFTLSSTSTLASLSLEQNHNTAAMSENLFAARIGSSGSATKARTKRFFWERFQRQIQQAFAPPRKQQTSSVPRQFLMVHSTNILEPSEPWSLYENLLRSFRAYPPQSTATTTTSTRGGDREWPVLAWNQTDCVQLVQNVAPHLVDFLIRKQDSHRWKHVCRVAALYRHGGYVLDPELHVLEPFWTPTTSRFVAVEEAGREGYLPSFIASAPFHPILYHALQHTLYEYYQNVNDIRDVMDRDDTSLASMSLKWANEAASQDHSETALGVYLLKEDFVRDVPFRHEFKTRQQGRGCCCNVVVHDGQRPYFFSHAVGASQYCQNATSPKPIEQDQEKNRANDPRLGVVLRSDVMEQEDEPDSEPPGNLPSRKKPPTIVP